MGGTRAMLGLVIGLGVLIVLGFTVVVATLAHRIVAPGRLAATPVATLGEPPGTTVSALVATGEDLALLLAGGGAGDRIVLLDARDGTRLRTIVIGRGVTSGSVLSGSAPSRPSVPVR